MSKPPRGSGEAIPSPDDALAVALSLAAVGWPVFPVKLVPVVKTDADGNVTRATDKIPLVRWLTGATVDREQILAYWAKWPHAWVGVHAGRAGIVIVDVDVEKGEPGADGHKPDGGDELAKAGIRLPKTLRYRTRSGGRHYVYAAPEGVHLAPRQGVPVPGVDIRGGHGLMVYYGPPLTEVPTLAPAPEWATIRPEKTYARGAGSIDDFLDRAGKGKPSGALKALIATAHEVAAMDGSSHEPMLSLVSELVKAGGDRGAATTYEEAREAYIAGRGDRARDWDNAATGSIAQHGIPLRTIPLAKAERKAIAKAAKPKAVEAAEKARKLEYRIAIHAARSTKAGARVLEDGPLAVEFAATHGEHWVWARSRGLLRYDGMRWAECNDRALIEQVRGWLDDVEVQEHEAAVRRGDNKGIDKARTLLSRNRARNVADLVMGQIEVPDEALDADHDLLNTPSGIVDLRTGKLKRHDPKRLMTKITGVAYDPKADMTLWRSALTALPDDVAKWLQIRFGQAATGYTPDDDWLIILEGAGENGKTTTIHAPRKALGDYSTRVPARLLDAEPGDHPTTMMTLQGARLAIVEELPEGRNLNVKRLKDAVGTPEITARRMRQDDVTFTATHGLFLSTNYLPVVTETDHGTWRRLALVRFPYRFVKRKRDLDPRSGRDRLGDSRLKRLLERPDAGVLRWLIEGARAWYDLGEKMPKAPKTVRRDTEDWRMGADPVLSFTTERLVREDGYAIVGDDLAREFNLYLEQRGHRPWSAQTINARFEGHVSMTGVTRKAVRFGAKLMPSRPPFAIGSVAAGVRAWVGVRFANDERLASEADRDAAAFEDLAKRASR